MTNDDPREKSFAPTPRESNRWALRDVALRYAALGWHVFPVKSKEKIPLTEHGWKDATTDEAKIRDWWTQWPDANIGVATGPSGLVVVDVDPRNGGRQTFIDVGKELPEHVWDTIRANTGGCGMHFVYRVPQGVEIKTVAEGLGKGMDLKGNTGYVVVNPSIHPSGRRYSWVKGHGPHDHAPLPFPNELIKLATRVQKTASRPDRAPPVPARIAKGRRDSTLLSMAGTMRARGFIQEAIEAALLETNRTMCDPPQKKARVLEVARRYAGQLPLAPGSASPDDEPEQVLPFDDQKRIYVRPETYNLAQLGPRGAEDLAQLGANGAKTHEWPVLRRPLRVVARYAVEGDQIVVVEDEFGTYIGSFEDWLARLRRQGFRLDPKHAEAVAAQLVLRAPDKGRGFCTVGVYDVDDTLTFPNDFFPRTDAQREIVDALRPVLAYQPTPADWRAYREFASYFEPHEVLPLRGTCAIAPAAQILRDRGLLVAATYSVSRESASGKSTAGEGYSRGPWRVRPLAADAAGSSFRLPEKLDEGGVTHLFDEAEGYRWTDMGATLKTALESAHVTTRGQRDLSSVRFLSRAVPFFTGNALPELSPSLLTRLIVIRYNEGRRTSTSNAINRKVEELLAKLAPIGPATARALANLYVSGDALVQDVRATAARLAGLFEFRDARRMEAWGAIYVGLRVWDHASGGLDPAPTLEDFVHNVVQQVELSTFEEYADPVASFVQWFAAYRVRQTMFVRGREIDARGGDTISEPLAEVKGQGVLFEKDTVTLGDGTTVEGWRVRKAVLDEYNKDHAKRAELTFRSLSDLARAVSDAYRLPTDILDNLRHARPHRFTNGPKDRAAFVPDAPPPTDVEDSEPDEARTKRLNDLVLKAIQAHNGASGAVSEDDVAEHLDGVPLEAGTVGAVLARLEKLGKVRRDAGGWRCL